MSRAGLTSFLEMCEKHQGSSAVLAAQHPAICAEREREKQTRGGDWGCLDPVILVK